MCLIRHLDIPLNREILSHPCEYSPMIGEYLQGIFDEGKDITVNPVLQYASLVRQLLLANPCKFKQNRSINHKKDKKSRIFLHAEWHKKLVFLTKILCFLKSLLLYNI